MDCRRARSLLIPFLESELAADERRHLEAHLAECEACQKEKRLLEETWSMLDEVRAPQVNGYFTGKVMAKIRAQAGHESHFRRPWVFRILLPGLAAAVALTVCILGVEPIWVSKQDKNRPGFMIQTSAPVKSAQTTVIPEADVPREASAIPTKAAEVKSVAGKVQPAKPDPNRSLDDEIIRNLDAYTHAVFYQDLALYDDLVVIERQDL